jgi:hypothetical protein
VEVSLSKKVRTLESAIKGFIMDRAGEKQLYHFELGEDIGAGVFAHLLQGHVSGASKTVTGAMVFW